MGSMKTSKPGSGRRKQCADLTLERFRPLVNPKIAFSLIARPFFLCYLFVLMLKG